VNEKLIANRRTVVVAENKKITSVEYERITSEIEAAVFAQVEGPKPELKHGRSNHWEGIAGYPHQIDVSVEGEKDILLAECKCWKKTVNVPPFLTFLGRILDIRLKNQGGKKIHGAVATTIGFQSGIKKLADHYEIELHTVTSPTEFAVKYKNLFSISKGDRVGLADEALVEFKTANKADKK
jgi:hypothetical protein